MNQSRARHDAVPTEQPNADPVDQDTARAAASSPTADEPTPRWKTIQDPEASDPLKRFKQREVVVYANGIKYQGVLVGADEDELYLRTPTRHLTIRMELVSTLDLAGKKLELDPSKHIDPSFYQIDDSDPDDESGA